MSTDPLTRPWPTTLEVTSGPGAAECGFGAVTGRPASPVPVPEDGYHVHVLQECAFPE